MSRNMYLTVSALGTLVLMCNAGTAQAQLFTNWWDPCRCCRPCVQACYQSVPVTEMQEVQQTVQRPVYEQKFVDQQVTEYHPVTETREAEVPTVNYVNVTENQTCTRDMGAWQTSYQCHPKVSPCQYDPRPGLMGAMNRTGYRIRSAFTPSVTAHRQYVPNIVAYNVPVTRTVAQYGTKKVAYNVTRMVASTTTRKVAVNTVRYETQVVSRQMPVTVMRQVPIGSTIAFGVSPYTSGTTTALAPIPDSVGGEKRTADAEDDQFSSGSAYSRPKSSQNTKETDGLRKTNYVPQRDAAPPTPATDLDAQVPQRRTVPSVVRVGQWTAVKRPSVLDAAPVSGPAISVADVAN